MRRLSTRAWVAVSAAGAFMFCLSMCAIVRSCEMARLHAAAGTIASLIEKDADYWRPRGSHQR